MQTFAGRKLSRPTGHRFALLRNMASQLLHHEKIETTVPKAREVARFTEKLITIAKGEGLSARRRVARDLHARAVQEKLFEVLVPRYKARGGGYTQLIRKGPRLSDGSEMGILKLVS
ncbi:MAG: 50S ribosomal protein L17 [Elusimicrobia bacterium RIFCSPLOWO2_01_FULL_59_12]|nr:MAG: 50S ribosomal protein L17 [Elusimicrobia bacterium RIFCSPLOWO2_01_FULL_59_12]